MNLTLPNRWMKPRTTGWTILIDTGTPFRQFEDMVESYGDYIDFVKFGWGTSLVTPQLERKIDCLKKNDIHYFFGGTLFEKFYSQHKVDEYYQYCKKHNCQYVEISNGTIDLTNRDKAQFIRDFSSEFQVLSEVGYKDGDKSINLRPALWVEYICEDLEAGAAKVITEARESGTSGICRSDGEVRYGLVDEILSASTIDTDSLIFEAPNKSLQTYFIQKLGTHVNLANIPFHDVIPLETLRLGLRSDTLLTFQEGALQ
jgi:phosphosulfolactate synthase